MHVEMEGVGTKPAEGRRTTGGRKTGQDWESREGDGRGQSDEDEAREEEFSALSNKFTRRRAAIDGIMNKVGSPTLNPQALVLKVLLPSWTNCLMPSRPFILSKHHRSIP